MEVCSRLFTSFTVKKGVQKDLLHDCHKLLDKFQYPWEMMPLLYAIMKLAPNLEEASRRIDEGKQMVYEYSQRYNLNMYDGGELRKSTHKENREKNNFSKATLTSLPETETIEGRGAEQLIDFFHKIKDKFQLSWKMISLVQVILKNAKDDQQEAFRQIDEAPSPSSIKQLVDNDMDTGAVPTVDNSVQTSALNPRSNTS
ncbi:Doublesex dimerization domain [Popillia japonica]|uniref:Doublesex dimerization domain n=1 Tax=Popillia japonica TaxID=7064 RepID=A0AAW1NAK4_POPJA